MVYGTICLWVINIFLQKIIFMKSNQQKQKQFHQDQKIIVELII